MKRHILATTALVLVLVPAAASAQNREHLQLTADLRIVQEQVNQLRLATARLDEQLRATTERLGAVSEGTTKGFADQQLLINQLATSLTAVRERLDDNTVRVSQLTQEFTAVREGVRLLTDQLNALVGLLQPAVDSGAKPAAGGATPPDAAASNTSGSKPPLNPVVMPSSAGRLYQQARGDYMSGRYDNAIEGFREVIEKFPNAPDAANAQFEIGDAYYQSSRCRQAIPEYQKVLSNYKQSDRVPEAYLMLGNCYIDLNQQTNARRMFEELIKLHPDSTQAIMATQRLQGMGVGTKP
jgi:tol-pal system protein YbgF